jgi:hypothetical protein
MPLAPSRWRSLGFITVDEKGKPQFPAELLTYPTNVPGNYRLTFSKDGHTYSYIGKTKDMRRRLGEYRTPTLGTEQEHILHYILIDAGGVTVEIIPESDLPDGTTRHALESEEHAAAMKDHRVLLLNKRGRGRGHYLKFKRRYHEKMLAAADEELNNWNANAQREDTEQTR